MRPRATMKSSTAGIPRSLAASARISRALAGDPEHSRSVTARARHALGLAALADGDYVMAYGQLRQLFTDDIPSVSGQFRSRQAFAGQPVLEPIGHRQERGAP